VSSTDRDNVQSVVADFAYLSVLVMHEVNEVRWCLGLLYDDFTCRLMEYHLIEDVDDLQNHLIIFLLRYNIISKLL